jgi:multisubunit Na+/H+ antiporter MnhB subunit
MFDFLIPIVIVTVSAAGIYGIFELLAHRKERLKLIEKMGSDLNPDLLKPRFPWPVPAVDTTPRPRGYGVLKAAGLLIGIGLGLLVATFVAYLNQELYFKMLSTGQINEILSALYGASVLLFGGLGLLTAFLIEMKMRKKE